MSKTLESNKNFGTQGGPLFEGHITRGMAVGWYFELSSGWSDTQGCVDEGPFLPAAWAPTPQTVLISVHDATGSGERIYKRLSVQCPCMSRFHVILPLIWDSVWAFSKHRGQWGALLPKSQATENSSMLVIWSSFSWINSRRILVCLGDYIQHLN